MKKIKTGKAAGTDCITIEIINSIGEIAFDIIHKLCCKIWSVASWSVNCGRLFSPLCIKKVQEQNEAITT